MTQLTLASIVLAMILVGYGSDQVAMGADQDCPKCAPELLKEIERLEKLYPEQSKEPRYERSGHQYTTFLIARMAGYDREMSHKLAYFSQFPDDINKYSATHAAIMVFNQSYRKQIMATLHSLHGGDESAVLHRRNILKSIILDGISSKTLQPYQLGLVIHAFADSYAHTKTDENGKLMAYGSVVGHLWHGHEPDLIAYNPPKYKDYACNLYMALALKNTCQPFIEDLLKLIDQLEKGRNAELPKFESFAKNKKYGFSEDYYQLKGNEWKKTVREEDVLATMKFMEVRIDKVATRH